MYGKALSEAEVAEGTLLPQEEIRARALEAHRRFLAMSPAEHLQAALDALNVDYHPPSRTGGRIALARLHLDAIPATAPEFARVGALRTEMLERAQRIYDIAARTLAEQLRDSAAVAAASDAQKLERRLQLALALDALSPRGIGAVRVGGPTRQGLRFDGDLCSQALIDGVVRPEHHDGLRALGFTRVRCRNRQGLFDLVPDAGPLWGPPRRP